LILICHSLLSRSHSLQDDYEIALYTLFTAVKCDAQVMSTKCCFYLIDKSIVCHHPVTYPLKKIIKKSYQISSAKIPRQILGGKKKQTALAPVPDSHVHHIRFYLCRFFKILIAINEPSQHLQTQALDFTRLEERNIWNYTQNVIRN
jgi:hypothetical protein